MRHLIDFGDLPRQEWDSLFHRASEIIDAPEKFIDVCRGKVSANLFYEPSTRTNFSFQTAMLRLGGSVFGFADPNSSSVSKGETLKDTVKIVSNYADVIVMRTPWEGAAKAASLYANVPVVNAGDGGHMHPTQTMADLTTITRLRGKVDDLSIGLCGDLKNGRTVHSLIKALAKFHNITFFLISPRELAVPDYVRTFMRENNMRFTEVTGLEAVMPQLDVLYMTRIQKERFVDPVEYERTRASMFSPVESWTGPSPTCSSSTPCPVWMRSPWMWTTTPGPSFSSRPASACSPAWPCWSTCPPSPGGRTEISPPWRSAPSPFAPTPAASPRPSTICPPWSKKSAAWTSAASATRPCDKDTDQPSKDAPVF